MSIATVVIGTDAADVLDAERAHDHPGELQGRLDAEWTEPVRENGIERALRRIEKAREDSIAALLRLEQGIEVAARDVARRAGISYPATR